MLRLPALGIVLLGLASAAAAAASDSGLYGEVTRGPVMPVCTTSQPCHVPATGVTLTFTRNTKVVARIETGRGGVYRIGLAPGTYTVREVHSATATKPPVMKPVVVRVRAHLWTQQNFTFDTGIR